MTMNKETEEAATKALGAAEDTIRKWLNQALDDVTAGKLPENYDDEFMRLLREVEAAARNQAGEWIKAGPPKTKGR
jgi:hypothetical protein